MGKCVIIGGADITSYDRIRTYLSEDDFCIYCDSGLKHRKMLGKDPDLIVGDFDSCTEYDIQIKHRSEEQIKNFDLSNYMDGDPDHFPLSYEPAKEAPAIRITPEKYDSDTMFGVREGLKRGLDEFLLAGAIGQRFDHSFANISILLMLDSLGKKAKIVDDYSEMEIVSIEPVSVSDQYAFFSLLAVCGTAAEISIENARYTFLPNREITCEHQYAISNEVLPGKTARITVGKGRLLLVKVFRKEKMI